MALSLLPLNALAAEADEAAALQMSDEDNSDDRSLMPTKDTYTITFDANGGKLSNGKAKFDVTYNSKSNPLDSHDAASNNILKEAPTYPAHKFLNWYYVGGLTGIHYTVNSNTKIREVLTFSSNNTVYAKWGLADGFKEASIFYLKDPTRNHDSNTGADWNGPLGGKKAGLVDTTGFKWTDSGILGSYGNVENSKDVQPNDVIWPAGYGTTNENGLELKKSTDEWNAIFEAFKEKVEKDNGVGSLTADQVDSITLVPYKVSRYNITDGSYHVDCDVVIKCNFVTVDFMVKDNSGNLTSILPNGKMTCPKDQAFPKNKVPTAPEKDGYEFDGWYTDEDCTKKADFDIDKPLATDTIFYGKYVEKVTPQITAFSKAVVTSAPDNVIINSQAEISYPENNTVTVPYGTNSVTLLYRIEVTGTANAVATVVDNGAELVGTVAIGPNGHATISGEGSPWTITFTDESSVLLYVTKTFTKTANGWGDVSNTATVNGNSTDSVTTAITEEAAPELIPVTLTANSKTVTYDGQPQSVSSYTSNAPEGVTFEGITATGSGTNAGEYTVKFNDGAVGKTDTTRKYIVANTVDGKLTINKCPILITAKDFTTVYNGKSPVVEDYTILRLDSNGEYVNGLLTDHKIDSYVTLGSGVDAGVYEQFSMDRAKIVNAKGEDVTSNYYISYKDGTLTINKRSVTLTSASASKVYDGTPLTKPEVTVGGDGFVDGEGATYNVTGTITSVGKADNTFTYTLNEGTKATNYTITKTEGKLTITEAPTYTFNLTDLGITVYKNFVSKYGCSATRSFTATATIEKPETYIIVNPGIDNNVTNNGSAVPTKPDYTKVGEATGTVTLKTDTIKAFDFGKNSTIPLEPGAYRITVEETNKGNDRYVNYDTEPYTHTYEFIVDNEGKINIDTPITFTITNEYTKRHTAATPSKPTLNTGDHYAYVMGYPDGTVRPNGSITRAEVSTILFRLLSDKTRDEYFTTESSFTDVKAGAWYNNSIATLEKAGVIVDTAKGGAFRPNEAITRAELAAMLAQFSDAKPVKGVKFSDVSAEHWAYEAIAIAAKMGWIEGYPDGTFRPDATITRAEMMTLVNRALERVPSDEDHLLSKRVMLTFPDCKSGDWFYIAVQEATNSHTYERAATEKNGDEQWTALRANRDWTQLEK